MIYSFTSILNTTSVEMFSRLIQTIIVKIFINLDKDLHLFIDEFKFEIQILDQIIQKL
jgi:hypothetical protein